MKAIVIGSTGMVGKQLIQLLVNDNKYSEIVSFVRRPSGFSHPKLIENVIDFDQPETWENLVTGDVLFSTLGTTIAVAKTKAAQYKVDFSYQYNFAEIASKNNVSNYVLISSAGANAKSKNFYTKIKGQLDEKVQTLPFQYVSILRPGQLEGNRIEKRIGEQIGLKVMNGLNRIGILNKLKPINAKSVANAMLNAAQKKVSGIYTLEEVHALAN